MAIFSMANAFTRKPGKIIQIIGLAIKLIPLLIGLVLGLTQLGSDNTFSDPKLQSWSAGAFFMAIAPIMFSLDGFVYATNLQKEVKYKKQLPKALFASMFFVIVFYVLISISIFAGSTDGNLFTVFDNTLPGWMIKIVYVLIVMSAIVSLNGMTLAATNYISAGVEDGFFFFNKKVSIKTSGIIQYIISATVYLICLLVGYAVYNDNPIYIIDGFSTVITVFNFLFYGIVIVLAMINRKTNKVKTDRVRFFWPCAIISASLIFAFISVIIVGYFAALAVDPRGVVRWFIIGFALFMVLIWGINELLYKKFNPKNPDKKEKTVVENININKENLAKNTKTVSSNV